MSANTPPKPHTEGMVFTNEETGIKYQFSGGAWRAVSSSASEEVAEAIDNIDLQKVLDNGNQADKGAEFDGKVIVEPGTEGNEAVTYGQLATVAEELEQLAPSFERGSWTWTTNANPGPGQYTTIQEADDAGLAACAATWQECLIVAGTDNIAKAQCQRDYDSCLVQYKPGPNPDFSKTYQIKFNATDSQGNDHTFGTVEVGQLIDVFNDSNDDYLTGEITIKSGTTITITRVSSKGFASGLGRIKIFSINDEVGDLTNYVRKTGDKMTGKLETTDRIWVRPDNKGASGLNNMLVVNQQDASDGSIARFQKNANDVLKVENSGNTNLMNNKILQLATPTASTDGANKKYVDQSVGAPSQYSWKRENRSSSPSQGYFCVKGGMFLYLSTHTNNGHRLRYDSGLSTSAQQWPGQGYVSGQYFLNGVINIWKRTSAGQADWTLTHILGAYKYRLGYNGFVELEFKNARGNWDNLAYEEECWINVNGLF